MTLPAPGTKKLAHGLYFVAVPFLRDDGEVSTSSIVWQHPLAVEIKQLEPITGLFDINGKPAPDIPAQYQLPIRAFSLDEIGWRQATALALYRREMRIKSFADEVDSMVAEIKAFHDAETGLVRSELNAVKRARKMWVKPS